MPGEPVAAGAGCWWPGRAGFQGRGRGPLQLRNKAQLVRYALEQGIG